MKKVLVLLLATAIIGAGLPGLVFAGPEAAPPPGGAVRESPVDGLGTTEVTGRVLGVDREQGALMLQTQDGVLALKGPPEALRDVAIGDVVRVRIAMAETPDDLIESFRGRPGNRL